MQYHTNCKAASFSNTFEIGLDLQKFPEASLSDVLMLS